MNETYLYPYSVQEAKKRNQLPMWRESYHANVACRNAIEETIRQNFDGMHLKKDCLEPVLAEYGYKRTEWVLATTLQELSWDGRFSRTNKQWAARRYIPQDERHNAEITVRSHPAILDGFVDLYREAYQKLGLFGPEHCVGDRAVQDYTGKVLVRSRFRFPSRRLGMQDFWARICTSRSSTVPWSLPRIRMMSKDHEYLYPYSAQETKKRNQLPMWRESYHANVACRNAIEETIRQNFDGMHLKKDCLEPVLEEYGYKRTEWVLATTLQELSWDGRFSRANKQWAARRYIPQDERHNAEITVRSHPAILDGFVDLYREAYQKLGLFGPEHCVGDRAEQDYIGKVLVLSPDTLKESCWSQENQLWYAHDGFGCSPHAIGRSVRCTCLSDGEMTRWNRDEFVGVLDEKFLPDWAKESLSQFQQEEAAESPGMNNQSM